MFLILLVAAFLFAALFFQRSGLGPRETFLVAWLPVSFCMVLITEVLGAFRALTPGAVAIAWSIIAVGFALAWAKRRPLEAPNVRYKLRSTAQPMRLPPAWYALVASAGVLYAIVGIGAFLGAPNTWDSMQYHLPRVVQWAGNHSVAFYPTDDYQQLFAPPFAEFAMLHTWLLSGGDWFVNLVQWGAWIGSILGVSLIAGLLGAPATVQALAGVLAATIPNAVCASSGPKNDCVLTFWIVLAVYLLLLWRRVQSRIVAIGLGLSLGFAVLTKGTAYAFLPAVVAAGVFMLPRRPRRALLLQIPTIVGCALAVNLPQYARNYQFSGSPLGFASNDIEQKHPWRNARIDGCAVTGNVVRNLACHLGTRSAALDERTVAALSGVLRKLGCDPNDPGTTWVGSRFQIFPLSPHEIFAGNPLHLVLFFAALIGVAAGLRNGSRRRALYALGIGLSFLTFCALLRYQPWNLRLHLPLFALGSVSIAFFLARAKWPSLRLSVAWLLLLIAFPFALLNHLRPIVSGFGPHPNIFKTARQQVYFFDQHESLANDYIAAADAITRAGCSTVGVDAGSEHFEYPVFALLLRRGVVHRIVYAGVSNESKAYSQAYEGARSCAIACTACSETVVRRYQTQASSRVTFGSVTVLFPNQRAP